MTTTVRRGAAALAAVALLVTGCGSSDSSSPPDKASTASSRTTGTPTSSTAKAADGDGCPVLASPDLDAIVGVHLTDHYASTQQPGDDSPMAGSVLCDFANASAERTAKVAVGEVGTIGTAEALMHKLQGQSCPALPGVGEKAYACSDAGQAVVLAQAHGKVVMAYRGGKPGGAAMLDQAKAIAAALLGGS
jgi:hypothetical protein